MAAAPSTKCVLACVSVTMWRWLTVTVCRFSTVFASRTRETFTQCACGAELSSTTSTAEIVERFTEASAALHEPPTLLHIAVTCALRTGTSAVPASEDTASRSHLSCTVRTCIRGGARGPIYWTHIELLRAGLL